MIPAIDYTPPVNTPVVIQVDYCDSTRLDTQWHPGWVPVYGSPWFCPTAEAEPLFTNPPARPQLTEGDAPEPQIGTAVYITPDGGLVVRRSARWWLV